MVERIQQLNAYGIIYFIIIIIIIIIILLLQCDTDNIIAHMCAHTYKAISQKQGQKLMLALSMVIGFMDCFTSSINNR